MAWAITSAAQAAPSVTSPITITHSGTVGSLYVLVAARDAAADPYTTITDTGGNPWTRRTYAPTSGTVGRRIEMWTCVPTSTFTSISAAFTGISSAQATLVRITGQAATFTDQINSGVRGAGDGVNPPPFTITPSVAGTLVLAGIQANSNTDAQVTNDAGWTRLATNSKGPSLAYRTDAASGVAIGVQWTLTTAVGNGHVIASYLPDTTPTGPTVTVWNGTTEVAATIEGVWNGTSAVPGTIGSVT